MMINSASLNLPIVVLLRGGKISPRKRKERKREWKVGKDEDKVRRLQQGD